MKAETYKARLKFLQENGISTADDLNACIRQAESKVAQLAKQRTILNVRKKKRKKLFDALAAEEALAMSKALYEEGLSGMEAEYAQYAGAKATLDACGISRQALTEEKSRYLRAACAAQQADPCRAAEDQAVPRDCGFGSKDAAGHCSTGKIPTRERSVANTRLQIGGDFPST